MDKFTSKILLEIQTGCKFKCSFCDNNEELVCYSREEILSHVTKNSYIILLGKCVTVWEDEQGDILSLLNDILIKTENTSIIELNFINLNYSKVKELLNFMSDNDNMSKRAVLSVQSGSNSVLRQMNLNYTPQSIGPLLVFSNLLYSIDLIIGYSNETDDEFNETLSLVSHWLEINPNILFSLYKYNGINPISEEIKEQRFQKILLAISNRTVSIYSFEDINDVNSGSFKSITYDKKIEQILSIDQFLKKILTDDFDFDIFAKLETNNEIVEQLSMEEFDIACKKIVKNYKEVFKNSFINSDTYNYIIYNQTKLIKNLRKPLNEYFKELLKEDL